ncbi:Adenine specific DNA methylase Mod [Marinovum algicola DG 898]|nr:Adenine specific DNA methylase Mod [Marinovum algicola DG 898]
MDALKQEDGESLNVIGENIEALKAIFPDAFTEDGVDFEALRQLMGDQIAVGEEKYGLTWHGKKKARQIALTPSTGTLRPCPEESVDWDTTQNIFIEGDNLESLKLLQKSYAGKVKVIYIDPPYNTGKEFIYPDKFQDNLDTYLKYTGQVDDEGVKFSSNTEASGRRHTNWLNMMYPRLKLGKNLLSDNGAIFISIDENESDNLKAICDEIFGEENLLGRLVWKNATDNNPTNVAVEHEYVLVYCKKRDEIDPVWKSSASDVKNVLIDIGESLIKRFEDIDQLQEAYTEWFREHKSQLWPLDRYKYIDRGGVYTGSQSVHNPGKEGYRYDIPHPVTGKPCKEPLMGYRFPEETMKSLLAEGKILFGDDHDKIVELKVYAKEFQEKLPSVFELDGRLGPYDVKALFPEFKKAFDNPKPVKFLQSFLPFLAKDANDIVLDFFAGSCSTAHALMELGAKDESSRRFIMVQLPELCGEKSEPAKAGISRISELSKERIRRAAKKIKGDFPEYSGDLGFKVFKLDSSNIRAWNPDVADLEKSLLDHAEHLVEGRSEQDVLYELLLKRGVDLSVPIEEKKIAGKIVYSIGFGVLFACLDDKIATDEIEPLALGITSWHAELEPASDTQVVFRDSAFADDIAKTNMTAILEQNGIAHVRSL